MKKLILFFIITLTLFANNNNIEWLSLNDALKKVKGQNKLIAVYMYSPYCTYCKKMNKNALKDEKVINTLNKYYYTVKIDGINDEYPKSLKTRVSPTFFFLDSNGEKVGRIIGYRDQHQFLFQLTRFRMESLKNEGN